MVLHLSMPPCNVFRFESIQLTPLDVWAGRRAPLHLVEPSDIERQNSEAQCVHCLPALLGRRRRHIYSRSETEAACQTRWSQCAHVQHERLYTEQRTPTQHSLPFLELKAQTSETCFCQFYFKVNLHKSNQTVPFSSVQQLWNTENVEFFSFHDEQTQHFCETCFLDHGRSLATSTSNSTLGELYCPHGTGVLGAQVPEWIKHDWWHTTDDATEPRCTNPTNNNNGG